MTTIANLVDRFVELMNLEDAPDAASLRALCDQALGCVAAGDSGEVGPALLTYFELVRMWHVAAANAANGADITDDDVKALADACRAAARTVRLVLQVRARVE